MMPLIIEVPNVSLTLISTAVLGVLPETLKISLCSASAPVISIGAVGKLRTTNL